MDREIKRGDLIYLNFDPIVGSEQEDLARRSLFKTI